MTLFQTAKHALSRIVREEKGAEGIEKILILAAVALPLLGVLLFFSGEIREWITSNWESVTGTSGDQNPVDGNPF